jgi:Ca2+/Na+ antiporter
MNAHPLTKDAMKMLEITGALVTLIFVYGLMGIFMFVAVCAAYGAFGFWPAFGMFLFFLLFVVSIFKEDRYSHTSRDNKGNDKEPQMFVFYPY